MKTRTLLLPLALLAACVPDDPRRLLTEVDMNQEAAPDSRAATLERVKRLGCEVEEDGWVRCPDIPVLASNVFRSVEAIHPPRAPRAERDTGNLASIRSVIGEYRPGSEHYELFRYWQKVFTVEDAMVRAGCETVEDRCADIVRAAFGWSGYGPPGYPEGKTWPTPKGRALPPPPEMVRGLRDVGPSISFSRRALPPPPEMVRGLEPERVGR